jgi:hypothetical protein
VLRLGATRRAMGVHDVGGPWLSGAQVDELGRWPGVSTARRRAARRRRMQLAKGRVHDGAVADASEEVALREQLVVRGDDRAAAHTQALGEGAAGGDRLARSDQSVADRRTQLIGELTGQRAGIRAVDG